MGTNSGNTAKNSIARCYATGSVTAVSSRSATDVYSFATGGFVGFADGTDISECYAVGSVNATGTGSVPVSAGGFAGYLGRSTTAEQAKASVTNCYALGNVLGDSASGAVYAGGLVGYANIGAGTDPAGKIQYNFAGGEVTAQSKGSSANVYAGGIVGYNNTGILKYNTAFGGVVTATGGTVSNQKANRICYSEGAGELSENYALKTMRVRTGDTYASPNTPTPVSESSNSNDPHGASAIGDDFRIQIFWQSDLGFSSAVWDLSGVWSRGYPVLKNVVGQ
jgi:hypothetical protein